MPRRAPITNVAIAALFDEIADLLEILGESPFRVRAYHAAARTLDTLGEPAASIAARGGVKQLAELPGIAKDLATKIVEIVTTGDLALRRELVAKVPEGLVAMMRLEGVGPKRAKLVFDRLGVETVAALGDAARSGRLRELRGFGDKLTATIAAACAKASAGGERVRIADAEQQIAPLLDELRRARGVAALELAGSFRRRKETVGDVDVLVGAAPGSDVARRFVAYGDVRRVLAHGDTKCSIELRTGLHVDLRVVDPATFGAALHYFTGSKAHNIAIRTLGVKRGLKISEYGVFAGSKRIGGGDERDVFRAVGLPFIPPELRENGGEIEAARERRLPKLVELGDLRGAVHVHTTASDGISSLEDMVDACARLGFGYVAITDHTRAVRVTGGMDRAGFRAQAREIAALREGHPEIAILHGAEVDVLPDGALDLDDATLAELDVVLAAVHSRFDMPEDEMTERVLRALRHPNVHVLAHPTGRLLGRRDPYAIDLVRVAREAKALGVMLEINAHPERLDLDGAAARMVKDAGAMLVIGADAHRTTEIDCLRFGVDQARRGWCTAADVANTRDAGAFVALLRRRASAAGPGHALRRAH
ncbi:MAG TPA: DNA polymerase/3'-5' exonuclease PolX, partial [Minicystis sp.]|nr:DNA polymerase/3'-5' exonuclease PolX [Minicystis sp.]